MGVDNFFMISQLWNDPVWSKVIATVIGGLILVIILWIYRNLIVKYFKLAINSLKKISFKKKVISTEILTENDIYTKIVMWWPKSVGFFPDDVSVDFRKLEAELGLPVESVKKYIDNVARKNHFKPKSRSDNYAVYEYDLHNVTDIINLNN